MAHRTTVYAICNLATGEAYIGESTSVPARWEQHCSALRRGRHHNRAMQATWSRDGELSFGLFLLECVEFPSCITTARQRNRHERHWQARARAAGVALYNDQVGRRRAA